MKKWLIVFLSLVISCPLFAAEPIEWDGRKGVFIEEEKAKKLFEDLTELQSLREQTELLRRQIELQKQLLEIAKQKYETEQEISNTWQKNYETIATRIDDLNKQEDFQTMIGIGVFVGGIVAGAATVYLSSLVLENVSDYRR